MTQIQLITKCVYTIYYKGLLKGYIAQVESILNESEDEFNMLEVHAILHIHVSLCHTKEKPFNILSLLLFWMVKIYDNIYVLIPRHIIKMRN